MKKLDKLVLKSFWGPFVITLSVVVFIFLMRIMIFYIDEFVSKDVGISEYARLFFYFAMSTIPIALPLAMLLSSLMAFGNLGEFFELMALKSAGISVVRIMVPLFFVALFMSVFSFFFNDRVVPWTNLKGYSLLYNIKETKATLKIKEGIFYNDLPGYSIKVDKKVPNSNTMLGMIIYKHDGNRSYERGNTQVILADSGKMYTINNSGYLVIELYNGNNYQEVQSATTDRSMAYVSTNTENGPANANFMRNGFDEYKLVVSMESFGMKQTDEGLFKYHEFMKDIQELSYTTDSLRKDYVRAKENLIPNSQQYFSYKFRVGSEYISKPKPGKWIDSLANRALSDSVKTAILSNAKSAAGSVRSFAVSNAEYLENKRKEGNRYELEKLHKYTQAFSCFVMFLIGAPLGAIIKKGGFGVPVLVSIIFFILMYVLTIQGDKYVKDGLLNVTIGAWLANAILLLVGIYFVERARRDSRIFEKDVYQMKWNRLKKRLQGAQVQLLAGIRSK
jgi:lipopolysaccharide export system permease protein